MDLPPSLARVPNIPVQAQTDEQLVLERDYWLVKVNNATGWGAALGASFEFYVECQREIDRRERKKAGMALAPGAPTISP